MEVKRILAVRNDRLGEFLLTIPALSALKDTYPHARLTLICDSYLKELAECIEGVDDIIVWERRKHSFFEMLSLSKILRKQKFDSCVIFNPSKEFNIISFLSGIKKRIGYNRKWGFLLTDTMEDKKSLGQKHEVEYNIELVQLAGVSAGQVSLSLQIQEKEHTAILRRLNIPEGRPLLAVHPFSSDSVKQWPFENFRSLIAELSRQLPAAIVIIGGKEEMERTRDFFSGLPDAVVNATGKTSLVELAVLLSKCALLISGDSGPVHLATCFKTPVLALFRSDIIGKNSRRWGPWGEGHCVIEKYNLSAISVDEVVNKAREMFYLPTDKGAM